MNQEIIMLSEVNETQKENTMYHYMWNLKYDMNECIYKTEKSSQSLKKKLMITKGQTLVRGGDKLGVWN